MLTDGMIHSTFKIKSATQLGTAVYVYFKNQHWIFTAKHLFGLSSPIAIDVLYGNSWNKVTVLEYKSSPIQDVAVLRCNITGFREGNAFPLAESMGIGQDLCFLGYPLGLHYESETMFTERPIPLYKKGCLSGMLGSGDKLQWVIDGMNNKGFSGGPVFSLPVNRKPEDISLIGIVAGYINGESNLYTKDPAINNGKEIMSNTQYVKENPGIMLAVPIKSCLELITKDWQAEAKATPRLK